MVSGKAQSRRCLALALTLALAVVACSSLWHHDHDRPLLDQRPAASSLAAPAADGHQSDYCPVCLSQRLLGHSWLLAAAQMAEPVVNGHACTSSEAPPTGNHPRSAEARAPPCC
jgi:hypothetical protein